MEPFSGPLFIAAGLLALAGLLKILRPGPAARALSGLPLSRGIGAVRLLGALEVAVGLGALLQGGSRWAGAVALLYLSFALFLVLARPSASCGCFGREDTPPSLLHLAADLALAVAAGAAVLHPTAGLAEAMTTMGAGGLVLLLWVVLAVYLFYLGLTELPALLAEVRRGTA